jgi:5'-nucleotidase/UDP-sugar diphosphatase
MKMISIFVINPEKTMFLKRLIPVTLFLFLLISVSCGKDYALSKQHGPNVHKLVVLHTNDTHGHPLKFYKHPVPDIGGMPARATLIKRIRKEAKNVLLLDSGDINTGRAESNFFNAEPDILGMNYMAYDAVTLGNHEFDNTRSILGQQINLASFPFICANIKTRAGKHFVRPFIIKEFPGFKVAILGLTTKETEVIANPSYVKEFIFEDEVETAKRIVPLLKGKADLIIALTHMGIYRSSDRGSKKLASQVDGIDLIVDGHTHTRLESPIVIRNPATNHETLIVQAWHKGLILGRVDILIKGKKIVDYNFNAIPINLKVIKKGPDGKKKLQFIGQKIEEDRALLNLLQPYADKVELVLSETIGSSSGTYLNDRSRYRETALGDIIADSMLWNARNHNVDFAIMNAGAIRESLPKGTISKKLIYEILPFDSSIVVVKLKGSEVRSLFDYIASIQPGEGAFPQVSRGVTFKINRKKGSYEELFIDGKPVEGDKIYNIATNSYMASGGDGYEVFLNSVEQYDTVVFQRDAFIGYIKQLGKPLNPEVKGRFSIIKEP